MDVRNPSSGDPLTEDERRNLTTEGFDLNDKWPEYGQASLPQAYRAGFHDALATKEYQ